MGAPPRFCSLRSLQGASPLPSSSWVLIEMAYSRYGACSQLRQPPLAGSGGRKQNPINVAGGPRSIQRERSLLSGLLDLPDGGCRHRPSLLSARSQEAPDVPLPPPPPLCQTEGGSFPLSGDQVVPRASRSWELAVGIGVCAGLLPGPLPGFTCLLWIRQACATPSPRFCPVCTPPGLGKT